jgi:hypothetical protein
LNRKLYVKILIVVVVRIGVVVVVVRISIAGSTEAEKAPVKIAKATIAKIAITPAKFPVAKAVVISATSEKSPRPV